MTNHERIKWAGDPIQAAEEFEPIIRDFNNSDSSLEPSLDLPGKVYGPKVDVDAPGDLEFESDGGFYCALCEMPLRVYDTVFSVRNPHTSNARWVALVACPECGLTKYWFWNTKYTPSVSELIDFYIESPMSEEMLEKSLDQIADVEDLDEYFESDSLFDRIKSPFA